MNNKRFLPILVVTVIGTLALGTAKPAFSADIYNANSFENFMVGPPLVNRDGWVGVPVLSPGAAVVSTDLAFAGQKSVEVQGVNLAPVDFIDDITHGYYDAIGSYRRPVNYNVASNGFPIVVIQAEVRIDGPLSPGSNFFSASIAARAQHVDPSTGLPSGTAGIGELAISSDGYVHGYSGDDNVPTFQASAPITLGAWHLLEIDLDFSNRRYTFYVDGTLLGGPFQFPSGANTNTLTRGSLIAYVAPKTATVEKRNYVAHYDNFSIATR